MKPRILLVDDEPAIQFGFSKYLSRIGYELQTVSTLAEAREKIQTDRYDAILLDMKLPDGNGLDWIKEIRPSSQDVAIVLITGHGDIPLAVEAMRSGADHFLTKPVNMAELEVFLHKSLELGALRRENLSSKRLKKTVQPYFGESPIMKKIFEMASLGAESESPILLWGETGTGKGVLARWIHDRSARSRAQFVEINCTSLKGELLVSELFGHAKGAFTSAVNDKQGLVEVADQGTIFLDEIGDMDLAVQAQFMKVIEEKQFRRLGEVKMRRSEFRLICATNRNLLDETEKGRFRKDLFFRINVFPIRLPPLRERMQDLSGLIGYFLNLFGKTQMEIQPDVLTFLQEYSWPGNIRELRNVLERAMLLSRGGQIRPEHFPGLETGSIAEESIDVGFGSSETDLDKVEELHVKSVLNRFGGDTKKASDALGISRAALYRKLEKYRTQSD
jgi:DNA-binding NtrC family response regulator